jgi:hypothetical protein
MQALGAGRGQDEVGDIYKQPLTMQNRIKLALKRGLSKVA